jgi:hypothetical protein
MRSLQAPETKAGWSVTMLKIIFGVAASPLIAVCMFSIALLLALMHLVALPGLFLWERYLERRPLRHMPRLKNLAAKSGSTFTSRTTSERPRDEKSEKTNTALRDSVNKTATAQPLNRGDEALPGTPGIGVQICSECGGSGKSAAERSAQSAKGLAKSQW